jgi:cytochrome c-type biogenesis protein CcmF
MTVPELRSAFLAAKALDEQDADGAQEAVARVYDTIRAAEGRAGRELKTPSTEVAIHSSLSLLAPSRLGEDFYVMPLAVDPHTGQANLRVFVNPMVNFLWLGGLIFLAGATLSVLPDAQERKRLAGAMAIEDRAVA